MPRPTPSKITPDSLLRCNQCSYVFKAKDLTNGLCATCGPRKEFANHPVWLALKRMRKVSSYLLECDPRDICNSPMGEEIIKLAEHPVWAVTLEEES